MPFTRILLPASLFFPSFAFAAMANIQLNNGDHLTAEVITQSEEFITIDHPLLGQLQLDKANIKAITINEDEAVVVADADTTETITDSEESLEPKDKGIFGSGLLVDWERRVDLGISGSAGKSRNRHINLGFTADYESDYSRINHQTAYYRADSEGDKTDSSFFTSLNRDWLHPDTPWFQFAGGRFDIDEFKDWDYRIGANAGVGYEFYNTDDFLLLIRSGLGFSQTMGGEREEFTPEGLIGVESHWDLSEYQHLEFTNTFYPSLKDTNDFRNLTSFDWVLDLNTYAGVALKVGLLNEFDSATEDDVSKNDFKYTVSLAWTL